MYSAWVVVVVVGGGEEGEGGDGTLWLGKGMRSLLKFFGLKLMTFS